MNVSGLELSVIMLYQNPLSQKDILPGKSKQTVSIYLIHRLCHFNWSIRPSISIFFFNYRHWLCNCSRNFQWAYHVILLPLKYNQLLKVIIPFYHFYITNSIKKEKQSEGGVGEVSGEKMKLLSCSSVMQVVGCHRTFRISKKESQLLAGILLASSFSSHHLALG